MGNKEEVFQSLYLPEDAEVLDQSPHMAKTLAEIAGASKKNCFVCGAGYVKVARHYMTVHKKDPDVIKIMNARNKA